MESVGGADQQRVAVGVSSDRRSRAGSGQWAGRGRQAAGAAGGGAMQRRLPAGRLSLSVEMDDAGS